MNWRILSNDAELSRLIEESHIRPVVIFKHSSRCSISLMVKSRLEKEEDSESVDFYLLDLLANRSLSNQIAEQFSVHHESPQVLLIKAGNCIYDESHNGIHAQELYEAIHHSSV